MHNDEYTVSCERRKSQMIVHSFYWDNFIVLFVQSWNTYLYYLKFW